MNGLALLACGALATVAAVAASADIPFGPAGIAVASRQPHTDSFPPYPNDTIWSGPMTSATSDVRGERYRGDQAGPTIRGGTNRNLQPEGE